MYYVMQSDSPVEETPVGLQRIDAYTRSWLSGAPFPRGDQPPRPLRLRFRPESEGTFLGDLYEAPVVVMSARLVRVLVAAGVDNLDAYPVTITDEAAGATHESHVAVNIIGVVKAADLARSEFDAEVPERLLSAAFDRLVIDEASVRDLLFFRLAENPGAIVVHHSVAERVKAEGWETIMFLKPEQWFSP